MNNTKTNFKKCDAFVQQFEERIAHPAPASSSCYYTGVDLGTACVVVAVLDENKKPVAGAYRYADVVRDGMVVDYIGAIQIVRELKEKIEKQLDTELIQAAAAIPPGTDILDSGAIKNVVQGAGFEMQELLDEPTAANELLQITDGAVVDIGGGTTGVAILKGGKVISTSDEATGGTHFSLVISGAYKMPFQEADEYKRDEKNHKELLPVLKPVIEKVASIISKHTSQYDVKEIALVGGTSCLTGIETIIAEKTGIYTHKPANPMFVTPLGIALSCAAEYEKTAK